VTIICNKPYFDERASLELPEPAGHRIIPVSTNADFALYPLADLYIDAAFNGSFPDVQGPLLFHCPAYTFNTLPMAPANSARFCAWPGFWNSKRWEIAEHPSNNFDFASLLFTIGFETTVVSDIPGLIAPRILCTLINEAAYTLADDIATANDIDTAMKLGTNYPKGPVEWAQEIGATEIEQVLSQMALTRSHYEPHPMLTSKIFTTT
jgi:3-hydroxybutyryl-CoA dehydrogenase